MSKKIKHFQKKLNEMNSTALDKYCQIPPTELQP